MRNGLILGGVGVLVTGATAVVIRKIKNRSKGDKVIKGKGKVIHEEVLEEDQQEA